MKFCCDIFSGMISDCGRKGFSIIPTADNVTYYFVLQFRREDYKDVQNKTTISQQAIVYCPWCGVKLGDVIANNFEEIRKIVKENRHLLI